MRTLRDLIGARPSFRVLLYAMTFGAAVRLLCLTGVEPVAVNQVFGPGTYTGWLTLGLVAPPLALLAWWLITHRTGVWRLRGLWVRLAADAGMLATILSYHLTVVISNPVTESRIYARYIVGAALLYVLWLIADDVKDLRVVEQRFRRGRQ